MTSRRVEAGNVPARIIIGLLRRQAERAVNFLLAWNEVRDERRALLEMDERMLRDIGVRREDAVREADRLRWRLTSGGLRPKR